MLPKAYIAHEIDHRLRLRVPSKKQNGAYFSEVREQLKSCDGVDDVRVNPATASVLIHHHQNTEALARYSREKSLFALQRLHPTMARPTWSEDLSGKVDSLDKTFREASRGRWDLSTLAGIVVLGLSAKQFLEGSYLPPAWSLFTQAVEMIYSEHSAARRR